MRPSPPGSPAGPRGLSGRAPGPGCQGAPAHRPSRTGSGAAWRRHRGRPGGRRWGRGGAPGGLGRCALPARPPAARCETSRPSARLQSRFEETRVPRTSRGCGRGTPDAAAERRPGGARAPARPRRDPPGPGRLAARAPPVRCQLPPAAAPRPSLPGPSAPFIFPRLRLGFCWFLGDKNRLKRRRRAARTNRAGRAMCAWLRAPAGSPGRGGGPSSKRPGSRDASRSGGPMAEGSGAASVSRPGRRRLAETSR